MGFAQRSPSTPCDPWRPACDVGPPRIYRVGDDGLRPDGLQPSCGGLGGSCGICGSLLCLNAEDLQILNVSSSEGKGR